MYNYNLLNKYKLLTKLHNKYVKNNNNKIN